jgi:L-threonylcarbamoyladenylate synthase
VVIHKLDGREADSRILENAGDILRSGGLVVFPTETVYGIGADALCPSAVSKIFSAKGRPSDNPLIAHISGWDMLDILVRNVGDIERRLMVAFWPGPFTIILKKTERVPYETTGGLDTVAVRMPSNRIAQQIIEYANTPIAAPSANISGRPSGTNISDIINELKDHVDMFIDAGHSDIGVESTVVRVIDGVPSILRPGKITPADIEGVAGQVCIDKSVFSEIHTDEPVLSPGMKYRHYAPDCECILVEIGNEEKKAGKIRGILQQRFPQKVAVLCVTENKKLYEGCNNAVILPMGNYLDYDDISRNLFSLLRKAENYRPSLILIEGMPAQGLGIALMNRLIRTCGYNIIRE